VRTGLCDLGLDSRAVYAEAVARHGEDGVTAHRLSETYESMLPVDRRLAQGAFYTPRGVARPMSRWAVEAAPRQVGPTPTDVLRVVLLDPACGCGVLLFEAAHVLAAMYVERLAGRFDGHLVAAVMPSVILECVFGMDVDPVAVELTRPGAGDGLDVAAGDVCAPHRLLEHPGGPGRAACVGGPPVPGGRARPGAIAALIELSQRGTRT
jgi:hypothetical protein